MARALLTLAALGLLTVPLAAAGEPAAAPERFRVQVGACIIEAPTAARDRLDGLAARAREFLPRLEASIGAPPAGPYRIILIPPGPSDDPEIAALDRSAPPWAAGFMQPWRRVGGIRVARADHYPYSDLASVLLHEAAHMLLFDAAGGGLPRWFEEGVATGFERDWGLRDVLVQSSSVLTGRLPALANLDAAFEDSDTRARAAYAASFDFMSWTVRRHGDGVVRDIARAAGRRPFAAAWKEATGATLAQSEAEWRRSSLLLYRWIPALTGSGVLWGGITLLALAAGARRRARSRTIRARFEAEERREAEARGEALARGEAAAPGQVGARDLAFFVDRYAAGVPPWEIGRPQAEFARLADERAFHGSVLDVGCGSGENALYIAGFGNDVWGIDGVPLAIEKAQRRADARGIGATFVVGNALALTDLGRTFDTAIDSGLFHVFPDDDRERYVRALAAVVNPGGRFFMLCFSEHEPGTDGPRRVTQDEIRAAFRDGWRVESIRSARFETSRESGDVRAWLAVVARLEEMAT